MTHSDPPAESSAEHVVPVGRVVGVFGLRGGLKVEPLSQDWRFFELGLELILQGKRTEITRVHIHKGQLRLHLEGITKPEQAEALRGEQVFVDRTSLPELEEGEFWASDLVGMEVVDEAKGVIGTLSAIVESPGQDLLDVSGTLIPYVKEFVLRVEPEERRIYVRLIPGMGPGEEEEAETDVR